VVFGWTQAAYGLQRAGGTVKRGAREAPRGRSVGGAVWLPEATFLILAFAKKPENAGVINTKFALYILIV
jgi:hypothetical protein